MNRSEYTLIFLLRLAGSLQTLAIFAIFLPTGTMDSLHRMLGLPGYWVWLEGPSIVLGSSLMLALAISGGRGV